MILTLKMMLCFDSLGDKCSFAGVSFVEFLGVRFFTFFHSVMRLQGCVGITSGSRS